MNVVTDLFNFAENCPAEWERLFLVGALDLWSLQVSLGQERVHGLAEQVDAVVQEGSTVVLFQQVCQVLGTNAVS